MKWIKLQFAYRLRIFSHMKSSNQHKKDLTFPIQYVKGIGPRRAKALADQGVITVHDLLYYFPFDYIDLSKVVKIANLKSFTDSDKWITTIGRVKSFDLIGRPPRQRFVVILEDDTGSIQLVFFQSVNFFKKAFTESEQIAVSGKVTSFNNRPQMVHPSIDRLSNSEEENGSIDGFLHTKGIVPKYGSSAAMKDVNLNVKGFRRIIKNALDEFLVMVEEFLPQKLIDQNNFIGIQPALQNIHFPETHALLEKARHRLKFDELFTMQLMLALRRKHLKVETPGIAFNIKSELARHLVGLLPFKLTSAQIKAIKEIAEDMQSPRPMNRLLQGDVGSGKTIVALLSMLVAVENGYQSAFMAPTEILAEQHFKTIMNFLKDMNVNVRLLTGDQKSKVRQGVLEEIQSGAAQIVVGTHALIQEHVKFEKLGFVVIDEQHRFGVAQRVALREKGVDGIAQPDILVMTATPIPRTLSLTLYGDFDVSIIDELPSNRRSIKTISRSESQMASVYQFISEQVREGRQVYIVYPLIEESEKMDLKAATESYQKLKSEVFTDFRVGLLHGRMSSDEKDAVMSDFKSGRINILVSTTVIEVGVDVPNASIMVVEHAERFGLSQLHQLRGRVGRGSDQSYCILISPVWMNRIIQSKSTQPMLDGEEAEKQKAVKRMKTMLETTDGFKIAEIDLKLRGPGDFFGTRQSGFPLLQIANLLTDGEILSVARKEAFNMVEVDPHLRQDDHQLLRRHFEDRMKDALNLLQGG